MRTNQEYKNASLASLKGNWAPAVVATIVYVLLALICTQGSQLSAFFHFSPGMLMTVTGTSLVLVFFVFSPVVIGYVNSFRKLYEEADNDIVHNMFTIPSGNYLHIVFVYFLMTVKVLLWSLLLIVPGIIKSFSYAMTPYIAVEHPEYSASEAIRASSEMMRGHKFDLFWLYLSFIGWFFLAILTCGIGFFWLEPYLATAQASFYNDLKRDIPCQTAE